MSTRKEMDLGIETLVAGTLAAGLLVLAAVAFGPVLALLGFFMVALVLPMLIEFGPKFTPQISEPKPDVRART
jgi:hypothetical protein